MISSENTKTSVSQQLRQYYVASGTLDTKIENLVDFIQALDSSRKIGIAVCCRTRDVLDALIVALRTIPNVGLYALHADLTEAQANEVVSDFLACLPGNKKRLPLQGSGGVEHPASPGDVLLESPDPPLHCTPGMQVLLSTDAGLQVLPRQESPLGVSLLVHYELPTKKDAMLRRQTTLVGSSRSGHSNRIAVSFLAAQELPLLHAAQAFVGSVFEEMPVHVAELLQQQDQQH